LSLVMGLALGGCAPSIPPAPGDVPPPRAEAFTSVQVGSGNAVVPFLAPPALGPSWDDPILRSPFARDPGFRQRVEYWIGRWSGPEAGWFQEYLDRMPTFAPLVDSALAEAGLPPSLRYLPIVESGYSPTAVSRASAVGLWQFMAPTARGMGMRVSPLLDQRRDPVMSTHAAVRFLSDLGDRFDSWFLALAAYNAGPARIERVLRARAPMTPRTDSLYWELRPYLPGETREFVTKLFAAAELATRPRAHGLRAPAPADPFTYDTVSVTGAVTLDVVAMAAGSDEERILRLNPEFPRGITPPGETVSLRVPFGTGERFLDNLAAIPPRERVTFVEHRVSSGETLSHIARRYRVRVSELEAANPKVRPHRLQIGQVLTVPISTVGAPRR